MVTRDARNPNRPPARRPACAFSEKTFQDRLRAELGLRVPSCRVFRLNAGGMADRNGNYVRGLPAGAADVVGLASGWFLSLEIKLSGNAPTAPQRAWAAMVSANGGIALTLTAKYPDDLERSVDRAVAEVRAAVRARSADAREEDR